MAFLVEDGTGLEDANAYISEQEYRDHHADRGVDVTGQLTAVITAAIVKATDYADKRFGKRFKGYRRKNQQGLEWPRTDAWDEDGYTFPDRPKQLIKGIAEYAWLSNELARELAPMPGLSYPVVDPTTGEVSTEGGGLIKSLMEKVDVLEEEVVYDNQGTALKGTGNTLASKLPEYPQADLWLEELIYDVRMVARG